MFTTDFDLAYRRVITEGADMAVIISETQLQLDDNDLFQFFSTATGLNYGADMYEIESVEVGTDEAGERTLLVTINLKG